MRNCVHSGESMKTREEQIRLGAQEYLKNNFMNDIQAFRDGAKWADENPKIDYKEKLNIAIEALKDGDQYTRAYALKQIGEIK